MQQYDDFTRRAEREQLRPYLRQWLTDHGINPEKNFRCLDPAHEDKHPSAFYTTGNRIICRSCGARFDLFDVIALEIGTTSNDPRTFAEARRRYGGRGQGFSFSQAATQPPAQVPKQQQQPPAQPAQDFTNFFRECAARINQTDYPQRRGLTAETCARFGLGFAPHWKHPSPKWYTYSARLIIPTSRTSYTARDTRPNEQMTEKERRVAKVKVGKANIYLQHNLYKPGAACIITEGEIDALSIAQAGGKACALRSIYSAGQLLRLMEIRPPAAPLLLLLDADDDGQKAQKALAEGLKALRIKCACGQIAPGCKDANDMLLQCPDKLRAIVSSAEKFGGR